MTRERCSRMAARAASARDAVCLHDCSVFVDPRLDPTRGEPWRSLDRFCGERKRASHSICTAASCRCFCVRGR